MNEKQEPIYIYLTVKSEYTIQNCLHKKKHTQLQLATVLTNEKQESTKKGRHVKTRPKMANVWLKIQNNGVLFFGTEKYFAKIVPFFRIFRQNQSRCPLIVTAMLRLSEIIIKKKKKKNTTYS